MIAGITSRPMTNPLFATAARNSRWATSQTRFMQTLLRARRLQPGAQRASRIAARCALRDDPDEHVLETKPGELDTRRRDRCGKPRDRIRWISAFDEQHGVAFAHRLDALDTWHRPQPRRIRAGIERLEMNRPPIELTPQSGDRLVEHLMSLVDHHHVLAHFFRVGHHVRGQQHRRTAPMLARRCARAADAR